MLVVPTVTFLPASCWLPSPVSRRMAVPVLSSYSTTSPAVKKAPLMSAVYMSASGPMRPWPVVSCRAM